MLEHTSIIEHLRHGYAIIPFLDKEAVDKYFDLLRDFFAQPEFYLKQFERKDESEIGFSALTEKRLYTVRNRQIPPELEALISYAKHAHQIALNILTAIEKDLELPSGELTDMVSKKALPITEKSASLLRLFSYSPSEEEGVAVASHIDVGLISIIPITDAPALEVLDFSLETPQWNNVEKLGLRSQAIVLVGKTLNVMSNGRYMSALHLVTKTALPRFSIVYQLRAEPLSIIKCNDQQITVEEWMQRMRDGSTSVNNSF